MKKSENQEIGKASLVLATFTLASRVLGLLRNQILSHYFGAGMAADAFIAAFTIPNALRRLFGEGALTPSLVSLLTRQMNDPREAKDFISDAFGWTILCLVLVMVLGILGAPLLVFVYVPEFRNFPGKFELTVRLTRFLFPFILVIGCSAFLMGILNTYRKFSASAVGPAFLNLTVLILAPLGIWALKLPIETGIFWFAGTLLVGALVQLAIQIPEILELNIRPEFRIPRWNTQMRELATLMLPSVFSLGIYQLNIIVNRIFASRIESGVSHLFYADLLIELPTALIATSIGTAVIPSFSRLILDRRLPELRDSFESALGVAWTFAIPAATGLWILAEPIVSALYLSGKFSMADAESTSNCLKAYAIGLPFFATLRVLLPVFFAAKNTSTPVRVGFLALAINAVAAYFFSEIWGVTGIAFAVSLSAFFNSMFLLKALHSRHLEFGFGSLIQIFLKLLVASIGMAAVVALGLYFLGPWNLWSQVGQHLQKIIPVLGLCFLGTVSFFGFAHLLNISYPKRIWNQLSDLLKQSRV